MYLRFVCDFAVVGLDARAGFFVAAYHLREQTLDEYTSDYLEEQLSWFRTNLIIPPSFSRSGNRNAEETRGLSWFKPAAERHLDKAFEMKAFLELHDYRIKLLKSDRIGYVVYEDEVQVVADPFSDTPVA